MGRRIGKRTELQRRDGGCELVVVVVVERWWSGGRGGGV